MTRHRLGAPRTLLIAALALAGAAAALLATRHADAQSTVGASKPSIQDVSYALGHDLGREIAAGLAQDNVQPDLDRLVAGFSDGLRDQYPSMSAAQIRSALVAFNTVIQQRKTQERLATDPVFKALAQENARKSREFMKRFEQKPGAKTLDGGIAYLVISEGSGATPTEKDTVVATFRALLTDGVEIASGTNVAIPVDSVTVGAQKVLTSMKVGDHWYVAIPPDMAFGEIGRPPDIGPNEVMVGDIQLIDIAKAP